MNLLIWSETKTPVKIGTLLLFIAVKIVSLIQFSLLLLE